MEVPRGFTRCDECKGKGYGPWEEAIGPDRCLSCSGSGLVPTEKLREEAITVGRSKLWDTRTAEVVDAVLAKVAEHLGDRE